MDIPLTSVSNAPKMYRSPVLFSPDVRRLLIIAVAALILGLPMLIYGPMPQSWDSYEHINFAHHFSEQFWGGELYPRWLINMNHGLGSPTLFVYPPIPSYAYTLLVPAERVFRLDAFKTAEFLALFGSGISAFLWLSTEARRDVALVCALLYMLMPYHLAIDYYHRSALSECWALVWMPLVLYFTAKTVKEGLVWSAGIAVAYALLVLSHLVTVVMFSLIPLAFAISLSRPGEHVKATFRVALGMLLGASLSSFYLVSAVAHAKYFPVSRLPLWANLDHHFLFQAGSLFHSVGMVHVTSVAAASTIGLCIVCAAAVLAKGAPESRKKAFFWLVPCLICVWMMSRFSAPIWRILPPLHAAIQYPGRFNIVLCVTLLPILAQFFSEFSRHPRFQRGLLSVLLLITIAPWLNLYRGVWSSYQWETRPSNTSVNDSDGWFLAWPAPGLDDASALRASTEPRVRFRTGNGTIADVAWKARRIEFDTTSSTGGEILVNQFYYPEWRASVAGNHQGIDVQAAMPEGILKLNVPAGSQHVRLDIPLGWTERAGRWISGISAILILGLVVKLRRETAARSRSVREVGAAA